MVRGAVLAVVTLLGCGRLGFEPVAGATDAGGAAAPDAEEDGLITVVDAAGVPDAPAPTQIVAAYSELPDSTPPEARRSSGTTVATDDRIWIFGGFNGSILDDIGGYTPSTGAWESPAPASAPPERERHTLAWDPSNDVLVVFGGHSGSFPSFSDHDELYVYAPADNTWTQISKSGDWPAPRKDAGMVWVSASEGFLLYGGNDGSGAADRFSDLWFLSIDVQNTSATWTQVSPGGATPPARSATCLAYDPAGRRLILHGGETQDGENAGTTYQYLVDDNLWQLDATTGMSPGDRSFAGCAWHPGVGRAVFYGGQGSSTSPTDGLFTYDPDNRVWEVPPLQEGSATPGSRSDQGAAYSPALGGVVMFGGRTSTIAYTNESWLIELTAQ